VSALLAKVALSEEDSVVTEQSGKLSFLLKLVDDLLSNGHRVLIFSQWQKMLDIIGQALKTRSISFLRMDGNMTKNDDRQRLIDVFNKRLPGTADVFMLTTQVGGLGITLTGADRAIIYDPSWNCTDDQAVDRIYRIGQQRNCVIYRLITCGTVEEKIYRKQVFK
jgi:SNF2 family DNA or RNA helicase